jgi:hypothetical protein
LIIRLGISPAIDLVIDAAIDAAIGSAIGSAIDSLTRPGRGNLATALPQQGFDRQHHQR